MFLNIRKVVYFLIAYNVLVSAALIPDDYDLNSAASDYEHHGRVQIKVYRGPTEHEGHESYSPWGYWIKQPAEIDH